MHLALWRKELLRQHNDLTDLIINVGVQFSLDELIALKRSKLFDCTWRLLVPMFISRYGGVGELDQIYCFGCASGGTVYALKAAFTETNLKLPNLRLFDSFSGLPAEKVGVATNPYWREGQFAVNKSRLENRLRELEIGASEYKIYQGFFRNSLNSSLINSGELKPALYIDIDCDLYISTYEALDFMFANALARRGTYIGYDDWGDTELYSEGESRAHKEIAEKYDIRFQQCFSWGRPPVVRKLFRVL